MTYLKMLKYPFINMSMQMLKKPPRGKGGGGFRTTVALINLHAWVYVVLRSVKRNIHTHHFPWINEIAAKTYKQNYYCVFE